LASAPKGTLYTGVTSNISGRMDQHSQELIAGFTREHGIKLLVYYEMHATMPEAIAREKRLKRWHRSWKYRLIEQMNPEWQNLYNPENGEVMPGPAERERLTSEPDND
jgi:putative endonuclease